MSAGHRKKVVSVAGPVEVMRAGAWVFTLECGHFVHMSYPADQYKNAKTMQCHKCRRGECVKHALIDTDEGTVCTTCGWPNVRPAHERQTEQL